MYGATESWEFEFAQEQLKQERQQLEQERQQLEKEKLEAVRQLPT